VFIYKFWRYLPNYSPNYSPEHPFEDEMQQNFNPASKNDNVKAI
jgi:hypothetical protein